MTAKRMPARTAVSSIRSTSACTRDFSMSSSAVTAITALENARCPRPPSTPAASVTSAATSVVPSGSRAATA